jgi:serine/threonine protein kinase
MELKRVPKQDLRFDLGFPKIEGGFGQIQRVQVQTQISESLNPGINYLLKRPKKDTAASLHSSYVSHLHEVSNALTLSNKAFLMSRVSLPLAIVEDNSGEPIGFLMKEFSEGCYFEHIRHTGPTVASLRAVKVFLNSSSERKVMNVPEFSHRDRLLYLHDFWKTLSMMHSVNTIVGDISGANLILQKVSTKKVTRRVLFLDVDSFLVGGKESPIPFATTAQWRAPEELSSNPGFQPTTQTDVYKGCLLTSRLMHHIKDNGNSSYELRKSSVMHAYLVQMRAPRLSRLIEQGLSSESNSRPAASIIAEEFELLARAISGKHTENG